MNTNMNLKAPQNSFVRKYLLQMLFVLCLSTAVLLNAAESEAASSAKKTTSSSKTTSASKTASKKTAAKKTKPGKWKTKNNYYYYVKNKERYRGFRKIDGKYYYFDDSGRQLNGWRYVKGAYRFFRIKNGKRGYMVTGTKINGVKINKKGRAVVKEAVRKKLSLLVRFQELADRLVRPGMKKKEKLVTVFKYARDKRYRSIGSPASDGRWDERLAEAFLNSDWADCTMAACGFAYLANAVGYKNVAVRLYGHGHCEINQLIYDPGFAKTKSDNDYTVFFAKTYQQLPAWRTGPSTPIRFI